MQWPAGFRFESLSNNSLGLWEGNRPILVYNHGSVRSESAPDAKEHSCYLHPIFGLDGEVLTGDFPKDHLYHRGLYWAWPHIKIAEKEYDLWSLKGIRQEFQQWLGRMVTEKEALLAVENGWIVGDKTVMREQLTLRVHRATTEGQFIDLELAWTPQGEPITLWGAPGKSYGGLTLRFGARSKTVITTPAGPTDEDLLRTKLPWADLSGDFKESGAMSGAALFVHPDHPDFPPEWMTREYGLLAAGWPGVKARTLAAGETVTCRYGVWVHRGEKKAAALQAVYDAW